MYVIEAMQEKEGHFDPRLFVHSDSWDSPFTLLSGEGMWMTPSRALADEGCGRCHQCDGGQYRVREIGRGSPSET